MIESRLTTLGAHCAVLVTLALVMTLLPQRASAWCPLTTDRDATCGESGVPLSWRRRCISYSVDFRGGVDLTPEQIEGAMDRSFAAWLRVTCPGGPPGFDIRGLIERSTCQEAEYRPNGGNVNTVAFISDWADRGEGYDEEAIALTTVWHNTRSGEIFDADILVNEDMGPYAICPDTGCPLAAPGRRVFDLENVMTHELGHFLGFAHTPELDATMYFMAGRGEISKRTLAEDDITALCSTYPASILPLECDFTPAGGLDLDCEDEPSQSGSCAVSPPPPARQDGGSPPWALSLLAFGAVLWARRRRTRRALRAQGH